MLQYLENMGVDWLAEDDRAVEGLINYTLANGACIHGYNHCLYINHHLGNVQLIATAITREDTAEVVDFNVHASGNAVWKVRVGEFLIDTDSDHFRRMVVTDPEGNGLAVVNIVNSEVLPSYAKDEMIKLQMLAFPAEVNYYENETAYADSDGCKNQNGKVFALADGTIFPVGLFSQENADTQEEKQEISSYVQVRGTVKEIFMGRVTLEEDTFHPFVKCVIDTQLGELEIIHTIDMVKDEMREHMKVGATVEMLGTLSGDAAIDEYEHGFVCSEENNLKVLRAAFGSGNVDYLNDILSEEAVYYSEAAEQRLIGKEAIVEWLHYVREERSAPCFVHYATVTEAPEDTESPYEAGTRCLILSYQGENAYENIVFADYDEEKKIARILVLGVEGYQFRVDIPSEKEKAFEGELIEGVDAVLSRANLFMLKEELTRPEAEQIIDKHRRLFEERIRDMAQKLNIDFETTGFPENTEAILGYFFAMCAVYKEREWEFSREDCCYGALPACFTVAEAKRFVRAREDGKLFSNDLEAPDFLPGLMREYDAFEILLTLQAIALKYE